MEQIKLSADAARFLRDIVSEMDSPNTLRNYSGRMMGGGQCLALTTLEHPEETAIELGIAVGIGGDQELIAAFKTLLVSDRLGQRWVLYWPQVSAEGVVD